MKLYIFDCAGQSIFNKYEMNNKYYENASAVMVVYDIGSVESYRNVNNWVAVVRNINNGPSLGTYTLFPYLLIYPYPYYLFIQLDVWLAISVNIENLLMEVSVLK